MAEEENPEKKNEEKKEEKKQEMPKMKDREDYEFPKFGQPKLEFFYDKIKGVNAFLNICSFLPAKDMAQIV